MAQVKGDTRTVLVVDDDGLLLAAYQRSLARTYTVLLAKTSAEALGLARRQPPDIAIVDLQLNNESGIDLVRSLKALDRSMFVVTISGYASIEIAVEAMRAGADDVLPKPITSGEILRRIGRPPAAKTISTPTLARAQWEHVQRVLTDCGGNISMAARRLGMYRSTLQRWLRKHPPPQRADLP